MTKLTVIVRDYNTKRGVQGAFIDLEGATAVTDVYGKATLSLPPRTYTIRVLREGYSAYKYPLTITVDGTITIELIPLVGILR